MICAMQAKMESRHKTMMKVIKVVMALTPALLLQLYFFLYSAFPLSCYASLFMPTNSASSGQCLSNFFPAFILTFALIDHTIMQENILYAIKQFHFHLKRESFYCYICVCVYMLWYEIEEKVCNGFIHSKLMIHFITTQSFLSCKLSSPNNIYVKKSYWFRIKSQFI